MTPRLLTRQVTLLPDPALLAVRIRSLSRSSPAPRKGRRAPRILIGIAGAPGSGKSALAAAVVTRLGDRAALVPMDGFHLAQQVLADAGTAEVKGAPETFDAAGYVALLERLAARGPDVVYAPEFDRSIEQPIAGSVGVGPEVDVVVTEGNYLLLRAPPWDRIAGILSEIWFLDPPEKVRIARLVARHVEFGRSPAEARNRATTGSDACNATLVRGGVHRAAVLLRP